MKARNVCPKLNLKIKGEEFPTELIVLGLKRIDVILGQNWLRRHKGVINRATKSIKIMTIDGKELELDSEVSRFEDERSKEDVSGRKIQIL